MGIIRFLLALSVLVTHSAPLLGFQMLNGDQAVVCFFIVSGFLMAMILETKYRERIKSFYVNRMLRIYPPYLAALLFAAIVFWLIPNGHHDPYKSINLIWEKGEITTQVIVAVSNLTLVGIDLTRYMNVTDGGLLVFPNFLNPGVGFGAHNLLFVPQGWTLALELLFYILAPWVLQLRTRWVVMLTLSLLFISHEVMAQIRGHANIPFDSAAAFPLQLPYFLLGALGYRAMSPLSRFVAGTPLRQRLPVFFFLAALSLIAFGYGVLRQFGLTDNYLYFAFAFCVPGVFLFGQTLRLDSRIGEYSYPIYLFHYPIAKSEHLWAIPEIDGWVTLLLTMVISYLYLRVLDERVQRVRRRIAK